MKDKRKIKISWRIFGAFAVFIAFILALLWLFQVVFLNDIYRMIKNYDIKSTAKALAADYSEEKNMTDTIVSLSLEKDVCLMVIDANGNALYSCHNIRNCILHKISDNQYNLLQIYNMAVRGSGTYLESFDMGFSHSDGHVSGEDPQSSVLYTRLIPCPSGRSVAVIVNATVSPVTATVRTLNLQLIFISGIMLASAFFIAILMSRHISRPIVSINISAKELSKGNYNVQFSTKGDKEIAELGETLNYTANELSKVDQFRRDLIANISHDMRTPLTMITGYAEVMRDIPGENTPENMQIIIDESNRLSRLVNDALDISKLQSGTMPLQQTLYDLTESIRETIERYQKLIERDGYTIHFAYDRHVLVRADEVKMTQVIYNLMINALNYTGEEKTAAVRQILISEAHTLRIEFEDFGAGIPKEQFPNIWDRYYKIDKNHRRGSIGSGLGLSIVRNILELHRARYGVRSTLGKGSVFWFELPYQDMTE